MGSAERKLNPKIVREVAPVETTLYPTAKLNTGAEIEKRLVVRVPTINATETYPNETEAEIEPEKHVAEDPEVQDVVRHTAVPPILAVKVLDAPPKFIPSRVMEATPLEIRLYTFVYEAIGESYVNVVVILVPTTEDNVTNEAEEDGFNQRPLTQIIEEPDSQEEVRHTLEPPIAAVDVLSA